MSFCTGLTQHGIPAQQKALSVSWHFMTTRMRYHLYLLTLFCILFSCSQQSGSWTQFQASGLRDVNEGFERMLFVDDKIGFLFGDYTSDEAYENRRFLTDIEATIYKTKDAGKSWTRTVFRQGKNFKMHSLLMG